ncbi:MAG: quinolinate synthase NadA [Elusimicrobiota bacterium]|jgi:quinolinate synthase|nr:quinolinate synthase NadA [Elusimicrobiota bacterium]
MREIIEKIEYLKKKKNAIVLAHTYQLPEIQDIADFVGDSLDLSKKAANTESSIIVFCGVHFMAETASILNPQKKVLLPDLNAGCPMADMVNVDDLIKFKNKFKNPVVVSYVNTTALVKAESYICCTSANAVNVVKSIAQEGDIIFVPDRNLGDYVQKKSGVELNIWNGFCPTHNNFILPEVILKAKTEHPAAKVLVHPECRYKTIELADEVMSTGMMCRYVKKSDNKEFIIGTETGILHKLKKDNPDKQFYPAIKESVCPNMKKITIEKVLDVLTNETNVVSISEEIRQKAIFPIKKMLDVWS